jgi:hypothetical protein
MHTVPAARQGRVLGALVVLALLAVVLFVATPKASAESSQCNESGRVCAWSGGNYNGTFSWWAANTGCHNHEMNPNIRSIWNRTGHTILVQGEPLGAGFLVSGGEPPVTGAICT